MLRTKYALLTLAIVGALWHPSVKAADLNKEITDNYKSWSIKFSQNMDLNDEVKNSISVLDSSGKIVPVNIRIGDSKTIVLDAPKDGYKKGEVYTINLDNKLHSKNNLYLKDNVKCTFKVNKSEINSAVTDKYKDQVDTIINSGVNKILKDGVEDGWQTLALFRHGDSIPSNYLSSVEDEINQVKGNLDQPIDYARTVIGLMSLGKDPYNFEGYNLIEKIYNNNDMDNQTVNTYIFSLVSLDAGSFNVPDNALWTRDKLIKAVLDNRTSDKGWDIAGEKADPDMTGMAITALAPYKDKADIKAAVDTAVAKLSSMQNGDGGFSSMGIETSESISQVIIGLCTNGIDPTSDKFTKNGNNLLDALFEYRTEDGGFSHIKGTQSDTMATEQAMEALEAYRIFKVGTGSIYRFK